jgi:hypothetical protein
MKLEFHVVLMSKSMINQIIFRFNHTLMIKLLDCGIKVIHAPVIILDL